MTMTETQQRLLDFQQKLIEKMSEVQQAIAVSASPDGADGPNLSPEEEKLLAARLGEFNELLHQVLGFVQRLLHKIG